MSGSTGFSIWRRTLGSADWGTTLATLPASAVSYIDTAVVAGTTYEYRLSSRMGGIKGFIASGIDLPPVHTRGTVLVLVDAAVAPHLATEIDRLLNDLRGDGWRVIRRDVARSGAVTAVRSLIQAEYQASPDLRSLLLLGAVPQPYAGDVPSDGHGGPDHGGAWPTDAYYGDVDGTWTDLLDILPTAKDPRNVNMAGDGKFDQDAVPSAVELETGRVDLRNMDLFIQTGETRFECELRILRRYLNRNHDWRQRVFTVPSRAVSSGGFTRYNWSMGNTYPSSMEEFPWRNYSPIVGTANVTPAPWVGSADMVSAITNNAYLLAHGAGFGTPWGAQYSVTSASYVNADLKAVFTGMFGSYSGDWGYNDALIRAPLAGGGYGLAAVWADSPWWFLHTLGIGETLGSAIKRSQNMNLAGYAPLLSNPGWTGDNCLGLMGDPTLRLQVVAPPTALAVTAVAGGQQLQWNASAQAVDPNFLGYFVYRAPDRNTAWALLTPTPVTATQYTDVATPVSAVYMVRAALKTTTASGSFTNLSQGSIANAAGRLQINSVSASPSYIVLPAQTTTVAVDATGRAGTPLSYAWSLVSGPGSAVFSNAAAASCTVTLGAAGSYVLRVQVSDGSGNSAAQDLNLTLIPAPYSVVYFANGATVGTVPGAQSKAHDAPLKLATNSGALGHPDLVFDRWNTQPDGLGKDYSPGVYYSQNAPLTLYAKWKTPPLYTWDGGFSDGAWTREGNWVGNTLPSYGYTADFLFSTDSWKGSQPISFIDGNRTARSITFANLSAASGSSVVIRTSNHNATGYVLTLRAQIGNAKVSLERWGSRNAVIGTHSSTSAQQVGSIALVSTLEASNEDPDNVLEFNRPVTGAGGLIKLGTGELVLAMRGTGSHTYTGPTLVDEGMLRVHSSLAATGGIVVGGPSASGVPALGGTGTINGAVTLRGSASGAAGLIAPGSAATPGTLTINNRNLTLQAGARAMLRLGTISDRVSGVATLALDGQEWGDFTFLRTAGFGPGTYVLVDAANVTGSLGPVVTGLLGQYIGTLSINTVSNDLVLTVAENTLAVHTITFLANGADQGSVPEQGKLEGVPLFISGNIGNLARVGYSFAGWNTAPNGTGTAYTPGDIYETDAPLTLHAQWSVNPYTIAFDSRGGSPVAPITADFGSPVTPPIPPTRPFYTFAGWEPALPATMPEAALKLKAKWTATLYWDGSYDHILTDGNGASTAVSGHWHNSPRNWDIGPVPHVSWSEAGCLHDAVFAGGLSPLLVQITLVDHVVVNDMTFLGRYTRSLSNDSVLQVPCSLTFKGDSVIAVTGTTYAAPTANSGEGVSISGIPITLSEGNLTLWKNYHFGDFRVSTPINNNGNDLILSYTGTSTSNAPISVTGSVSGSGGLRVENGSGNTVLGGINTFTGITRVTATNTATDRGELRLTNFLALQNSPLDTSGSGRVKAASGTGTYVFGGLVSGTSLATVITSDTSVTTLQLNPQGGTFNYDQAIANLGSNMGLVKTGSGTQVLGGANSYTGATTVRGGTLLINGAQIAATGTVSVGGATSSGIPTLGGTGTVGGNVTIAAAAGGAAGTLAPGGASAGVLALNNRNLTLEVGAKMVMRLGSISDRVNGVAALALNGQQWSDFTFTPQAGFGPGSYVLVAANTVSGTLGAAVSGTIGSYTGTLAIDANNDLVLTVSGSGPATYAVTYNSNGATGGSVPVAQTKTQGVPLLLAGNSGNLVRSGHGFNGWNTAANGSGVPYAAGSTYTADAAVTLYAQWIANLYTLSFDSAGGSAVSPISLAAGSPVTAPANPTRSGYTFNGWSPALPAAMPSSNLTVVAQWAVNSYTITFNSAGGSAVAPITQPFGSAVAAPANPTRTGYTFNGWSPALPATMPAANITITAQWSPASFTITFDSAGGSAVAPITQTFGSTIVAPANPTRSGYTFTGWSPALPATMPSNNLTVTAQWTVASTVSVWNGSTDASWATAGNWDSPPVSGSSADIVFHAAGAGNLNQNFLASARTIRSLAFDANADTAIAIRTTTTLGGTTAADLTFQTAAGGTSSIMVDPGAAAPSITVGIGGGNIVLNNSVRISNRGSGVLASTRPWNGAGGVILDSGTFSFDAAGVSSYTGGTQVNGGELRLNRSVGVAAIGSGTLAVGSGTVRFTNGNDQIPDGTALSLGAGAVLDLNGRSDTVGAVTLSGGTIQTGTGALTLAANLAYSGSANPAGSSISGRLALGTASRTFTIGDSTAAANDLTVSATISGTVGLTKAGTGTLLLSGSNGYTGATAVNAGTLKVNGSLHPSSAVSVAAGATVSGSGTIGGTLAVNGIVSPGEGIGTLRSGAASFAAGSRLLIAINDAPAVKNDTLAVNGALTVSGGTLEFAVTGAPSQPTYILATYTGAPPAGVFASVVGQPAGYDLVYNHNGNSVALVKRPTAAFAAWAAAYPTLAGIPDADSDGDGIPDGIEFIVGSNPETVSSQSGEGTPELNRTTTGMTLTFKRSLASRGVDVFLDIGSVPGVWTQSLLVPTADGVSGAFTVSGEDVSYTPLMGAQKTFFRLRGVMEIAQ